MRAQPERARGARPDREPTRHLLVVDDDQDFAEALCELFDDRDWGVVRAASLTQARARIRDRSIDVALVDVRLGAESGFEFVRMVSRECPDAVCVMMTAFQSVDTAITAVQAGAWDYLRKPFEVGELLAALDRAFERVALRRAFRRDRREIERANRALSALHECSAAVVRAGDEGELLEALCRIVVDRLGFAAAAVGLCAESGFLPAAVVDPSGGTADALLRPWADAWRRASGGARGRPSSLVTHDLRGDFRMEALAARGYEAAVLIPVVHGDDALGALSVCVPSGLSLEVDDVDLLERLATDVAFGMTSRRTALERAELHRQLSHAQKMEALGRLSGGIAHDFNNQLTVIRGHASLVNALPELPAKAHVWLEDALEAVDRCAGLTRQMLAFSRRRSDEREVVDLSKKIQALRSMIASSLTPTLRVHYELADDLWPTSLDPGEFHNVLLNLVINARDATKAEGGEVWIQTENISLPEVRKTLHAVVQPGAYVRVSVRDDGAGMSPEVYEHALEPFYTTKPEGEGTGLGLSMAYGFAHGNGGHLDITSEPGAGTTVCLLFRHTPSLTVAPSSAPPMRFDQVPSSQGELILVVDDEVLVVRLAERILKGLGYRVLTARDATEARRLLEAQDIDLLFSDVVMPGESGFDLAAAVRERWPKIEILLASGYTAPDMPFPEEFRDRFLAKPYRPAVLARRIRELLDARQRA